MRKVIAAALLTLIYSCCGQEKVNQEAPDMNQVNRQLININRELIAKESARIDGWIKRNGHSAEKTGTGLRIIRKETHTGQPRPKPGNLVTINYNVKLLDGTECYSTRGKKPEVFKVEMAQVESGLHEGVQYLHKGDKAIFVLPPHLAHGLIGDQEKIPPMSSIIYEIELIEIQ
ncbi:MAG: hypothetical protein RLZZ46_1398 [Bacteroidota bacterium]|jgi:FKBP-type peptidyl-prolyl cis-trans isomerase